MGRGTRNSVFQRSQLIRNQAALSAINTAVRWVFAPGITGMIDAIDDGEALNGSSAHPRLAPASVSTRAPWWSVLTPMSSVITANIAARVQSAAAPDLIL
jgi:hypothetical protein